MTQHDLAFPLADFAADYPDTWNPVLATRYRLTLDQVAHLARKHAFKKTPGSNTRRLHAAYMASIPKATVAIPPERLPRYPSLNYCTRCGLSDVHLRGCPAGIGERVTVVEPNRIRRDDQDPVAA